MTSEIISRILKNEGGFSDRAADKGGPTNFGITMPTLAAWRKSIVTREDIVNLTREEAIAIYTARYAAPWSFIEDSPLRDVLIDWSVTSGLSAPTKALQAFLNSVGLVTIEPDGILGNMTRQAWKATILSFPQLIKHAANEVAQDRVRFYVRLALRDDETKHFMATHPTVDLHNLGGWVNRALGFLNIYDS